MKVVFTQLLLVPVARTTRATASPRDVRGRPRQAGHARSSLHLEEVDIKRMVPVEVIQLQLSAVDSVVSLALAGIAAFICKKYEKLPAATEAVIAKK